MKKIACIVMILMALACAAALATEAYTDDISSNYALELDGVAIQLPAPLSALLDNGWTLNEAYQGVTMPAMSYDSLMIDKGNASISITIVNAEDAEKPLTECSLAGLLVFDSDGVGLKLANGISFGSTADAVISAYALDKEALLNEYAEGSTGFSLSFYAPEDDGMHTDKGIGQSAVGMNQIDFNFEGPMAENGKLSSIQLRFMAGA